MVIRLHAEHSYHIPEGQRGGPVPFVASVPLSVCRTLPWEGTGGHAKASLYYNDIIEDLGLVGAYDKIRIGDKVRMVYIHSNNTYGIDVIAWPAHVTYAKEFESLFNINRRVMFYKTVMSPLDIVVELNQWFYIDPCVEVEVDIMSL